MIVKYNASISLRSLYLEKNIFCFQIAVIWRKYCRWIWTPTLVVFRRCDIVWTPKTLFGCHLGNLGSCGVPIQWLFCVSSLEGRWSKIHNALYDYPHPSICRQSEKITSRIHNTLFLICMRKDMIIECEGITVQTTTRLIFLAQNISIVIYFELISLWAHRKFIYYAVIYYTYNGVL